MCQQPSTRGPEFGRRCPRAVIQRLDQRGAHVVTQLPGTVPRREDESESESERPFFLDRKSPIPFEATGMEVFGDAGRPAARGAAPLSAAKVPIGGFSIVPAEPEFAPLGSKKSAPLHKRVGLLIRRRKPQEAPELLVAGWPAGAPVGRPNRKASVPMALQRLREKVSTKGNSTRVVPFEMPDEDDEVDGEEGDARFSS